MQCRLLNIAQLPSGKAPDFDSGIRWFESNLGSQKKGSALAEPDSSKGVISMTKDEFYDQISNFDDLIGFCEEYNCYHLVEDLKPSDDFDDQVWGQLEDLRHSYYWYDLRAALNEIEAPIGDYFIPGTGLEYSEVSDADLDSYVDDVIDWGDEEGFWDEEDDEEYDDDDSDCCWDEVVQEEDSFTSDIEITMLIGVA